MERRQPRIRRGTACDARDDRANPWQDLKGVLDQMFTLVEGGHTAAADGPTAEARRTGAERRRGGRDRETRGGHT